MRLVTGPAGSGKTTLILNRLREALRAGTNGIRLLVPTATLAQHLQNQIAREGFVFRPDLIQTLSSFVDSCAGAEPKTPDPVLYLMVEEAARRRRRPEFARVVDTPGFCARLAQTILEFSSAGCDSARLATCLPDAPLAHPFLEIYEEVDQMLAARGLALRARRLEQAAAHVEREGTGAIRTMWLDGFHALPEPELRLVGALNRALDLTVALSDNDLTPALRTRLGAIGFHEERSARALTKPAVEIVVAKGMERETEEIARRILEQAAAGRPFREMGIIARSAENYVPLLRSTLERFGIPARFYFEEDLQHHAAIRFLTGVMDAMLGGWDHGQTLAVLRLAPRFADSNAIDRFDFAVREQIPNAGLGALKALAVGSDPLLHKIDTLGETEEWRRFELTPKDWAARFRTLRNLFRPARPEVGATHQAVDLRRGQAEALNAFDEALDEAALALGDRDEMELEHFWRAVKSVLRLKPLRLRDGRRNVVHVLSAHEARQWVLPVVFVCGMTEKQFPQFHNADLFFPEAARQKLNEAGIRVRTALDFEQEERGLFESAITRATMSVTLSYPELDARGQKTLRSLFLEERLEKEQQARTVRPRRRDPVGPWSGTQEGIRSAQLLPILTQRTREFSPTGLESYLQCPFQYFGRQILRLKARPLLPRDRLDFMTQGIIVHEVLAQWYAQPQDIGPVFEEVYARKLEEKQIPSGYHTERLRNAMLDDLRAFAADDQWQHWKHPSRREEKFRFALAEGVDIVGKIDRVDETPDGAWVIDYKYSRKAGTKERTTDETLLQAPLYLMGAERALGLKAAGMYYIGLKGEVVYARWAGGPLTGDWMKQVEERTLALVANIRGGRLAVSPANRDKCGFCDFSDACRVQAAEASGEVEAAGV